MNHSKFRAAPSRLVVIVCLCAVTLFAMANPAQAATLTPGTSIANDSLVAAAGGGTLLVDTGNVAYTQLNSHLAIIGAGTVREIVVSGDTNNTLGGGGLDFIYQVKATSGFVKTVALSDFTGFLTDASAVTAAAQNPNNPPLTPAFFATAGNGLLSGATPISRTGDGSTVNFAYSDSTPFGTSVIMIVRTNATGYNTLGNVAVIDGGTANVSVFAPTPEPSSVALFGICLAGMAGYGWRRRRTNRKELECPGI